MKRSTSYFGGKPGSQERNCHRQTDKQSGDRGDDEEYRCREYSTLSTSYSTIWYQPYSGSRWQMHSLNNRTEIEAKSVVLVESIHHHNHSGRNLRLALRLYFLFGGWETETDRDTKPRKTVAVAAAARGGLSFRVDRAFFSAPHFPRGRNQTK